MPSGPKKRKAAKRKMESQSNTDPNPSSADANSHGDDDVKIPYSEVLHNEGDSSSPTSQDHLNDHEDHLLENEKDENREGEQLSDPSQDHLNDHEDHLLENEKGEGEQLSDPSQDHLGDHEDHLLENEKEENGEGEQLSDPSPVDDVESEGTSDINPNETNGGFEYTGIDNRNGSETQPHEIKGVSLVDSEKEELGTVSVEGEVNAGYDKSNEENERSEIEEGSSNEAEDHSYVVKGSQDEGEIIHIDSVEIACILSAGKDEEASGLAVEELRDSATENIPKVVVSEQSPLLPDKAEETVEELAIDEIIEKSSAADDFTPKDIVLEHVEALSTVSSPQEVVAEAIDDSVVSAYNVAEHDKEFGVNEPLLTTAPRPVQTTFWNGCCGLFEVFKGSGR